MLNFKPVVYIKFLQSNIIQWGFFFRRVSPPPSWGPTPLKVCWPVWLFYRSTGPCFWAPTTAVSGCCVREFTPITRQCHVTIAVLESSLRTPASVWECVKKILLFGQTIKYISNQSYFNILKMLTVLFVVCLFDSIAMLSVQ